MSEVCKEFHSAVFNHGIPTINKNIRIKGDSKGIVNKKEVIFSKLMKDPMLLSNKDFKIFHYFDTEYNAKNNFEALSMIMKRFHIYGPVRIQFNTWYFIQYMKERFLTRFGYCEGYYASLRY
jgi:hypothetical protein